MGMAPVAHILFSRYVALAIAVMGGRPGPFVLAFGDRVLMRPINVDSSIAIQRTQNGITAIALSCPTGVSSICAVIWATY